jgi:RHS repeat-associated protein
LLTRVTKGNGSFERINYGNCSWTDFYPMFQYPVAEFAAQLNKFPVVNLLTKQSKNTSKYQKYIFLSPVMSFDGRGFLGFDTTLKTDWYDDPTKIVSNITNFDMNTGGALKGTMKIEGLINPSNYYYNSPNILQSTRNTYNYEDALQTNKVFKLKNTKTETWNSLDNTSSESTSILDVYNNPTTVTTNVKNNGVIEKTTISTFAYDNQPTATTFVIGRPTSKVVNTKIYPGQANEDTAINEEQYAYTNHLLNQIKKKATNSGLTTGFLTEDNIFDAFGNITRKTITAVGETPRVTNFEYSATYGSRFLTKSIDVEGLETLYTYDANKGLVLTELMPSNAGFPLLTTNTYDTWGKKIKVKNYLNKEINYAYTRDVEKTLITATSDDGSSTTELYDDLGRKIKTGSKTIDGTWAFTETEYDNFDRAIKTSEPYFDSATKLWNETSFDNYGRPLQIKAATGKIANYTYPAFLTVNVNDGTLNKTNVKNALGNVISLTDTPGGTITYNYFANGNLKKTIFDGQETIITQDGWGRKTKLVEPSAGEYNYTYNGFGQPLTETTPNGITAYTYTNIGKLNTKWVKGKPSPDGTFSGTNILSTYAYYPNKMLESITVTNPNDGNSTYNYNYDNNKRIIYTKEEFTTIAPRKFENNLEYDEYGRILSEISTATINGFVSAKTIFNEYKNGELFKKRENSVTGNPIWTLNSRNARGQITSATLGDNLIAHTNTYHDLGHTLTTNYNKVATPTVNIMTLTNTYDYVQGNMLTRSNSLFAWNETFTYDSNDRLATYTDKNGLQITQEYENNGKIKNNALGTYRYSTAKPYQNTSIKLTPEGLLEPGLMQTQTIVYSAFKAPLSIVQGSQKAFFGYNFAQDRSVMYFGNSNTNKLLQPKRRFYSADGTMEITMTLATTTLPASYEFTTYIGGDAYTAPALARQQDNQTSSLFYLHRDHLGTILAITNSLGDVVEKRLFDAWGDVVKVQNGAGVTLTRFTFIDRGYTGHEHLQSFRLINMNARLYDPRLHRFLQPDNNLQEPYNTQNYNRYGYVLNNPLKYTDPTGELTWSDIVSGVAIVAGAILCFVPGAQVIGGALVVAGVGHFRAALINYNDPNSGTKGNWDASSTNAGLTFSTTVDTDFGYGGGGKKDVANNNNPLESHNYATGSDIYRAKSLSTPSGNVSNNKYDYYNNGQVFSNQGELESYINKFIGNQDKIEKALKTCFILANENNLPNGYSFFDNDIIKPDGGRAGGVTVPMLKNSSNIFIAPSLKGDYFGNVRATSSGIVHESLHAYHLNRNLSNYNIYSEAAASTYTYAYLKAYGSSNGASFYYSEIIPYPKSYNWRNLPSFINTGLK